MNRFERRQIYQKRECWCREIKDEKRKKAREHKKYEKQQKISTSFPEVKKIKKDDVGECFICKRIDKLSQIEGWAKKKIPRA